MQEFKGRVAVVTGGASGIGRALAERSAQEGMKVVLVDIEEKALAQTEQEMKAAGATVLAVRTDVSKAGDVEALAQKTLAAFGGVHLLCNNAGVTGGTSIWESTLKDWQWILGVNLWGVIHGVRFFIPIMLEQGTEGHVVNTASLHGFMSAAMSSTGIYRASKHAVVSLSETLYHELAQRQARIHVSVLCPGWTNTRIVDAARNRPVELENDPSEVTIPANHEAAIQARRQAAAGGIPPQRVADCVFDAIRAERFYIFTHPERSIALVRMRMEDILQGRNPTNAYA